jgi:hypothetical protein
MATIRFTWFGFVVDFNHSEITQITSAMNSGAATSAAVTSILTGMGITRTPTAITAAVTALLNSGARALNACNSKRSGIHLCVCWVGPFWCRTQ